MSGLAELAGSVSRPDEHARRQARAALAARPGGSAALGRLGELSVWLAGAQGGYPLRPVQRPRLIVLAADHGVAAADVDDPGAPSTAEALSGLATGAALVNEVADVVGVALRVVDLGVADDPQSVPAAVERRRVRAGTGRIDVEDAMTRAEAEAAFMTGIEIADEEIDSGADLILCGQVGAGATTAGAVLVAALANRDPASVCGSFGAVDDGVWIRRCAAIRDALRRARPVLGDQAALLATVGGPDLAALTGLLLRSAARRTPVVVDGVAAAAAALVAHRMAFRAADWWLAADRTGEPAHEAALDRLSLEPMQTWGMARHDGTAALLGVPALRAAAVLGGRA